MKLTSGVCVLCVLGLVQCGSSSTTGNGSGTGGGGGAVAPTCYDAAGSPTSDCAVTASANICSRGDANSCLTLQTVGIYAATGGAGVCMHLVFNNTCSTEAYSYACIGTTQYPEGYECWTSSTLPGFTVDVSQCDATGDYFSVATSSSGLLSTLEQQCSAPE